MTERSQILCAADFSEPAQGAVTLNVVGVQATIAALTLGPVDTLIVSASSDAMRDDRDADAPVADGADVNPIDGTPTRKG